MSLVKTAITSIYMACTKPLGQKERLLPMNHTTRIVMTLRRLGFDLEIVVHRRNVKKLDAPIKWRMED